MPVQQVQPQRVFKPLNEIGPSNQTKLISSCIQEHLVQAGCEDTASQKAARLSALHTFRSALNDWIESLKDQPDFFNCDLSQFKPVALPFGSYALGAHDPSADIDMLVLACAIFDPNRYFFGVQAPSFQHFVTSYPGVQHALAVPEGHVPVLKLTINNIHIDTLFATLPIPTFPNHKVDLEALILLGSMSQSCVYSLAGYLNTRLIVGVLTANSPSQYPHFTTALKYIKHWSRARGIYSNVLGYLGGVNWALLLAKIATLYPRADTWQLVQAFFYTYATWNWNVPVRLLPHIRSPGVLPVEQGNYDVSSGGDGPAAGTAPMDEANWAGRKPSGPSGLRDVEQWALTDKVDTNLMPIITVGFPAQNSVFNVTNDTFNTLKAELQRGKQILARAGWNIAKKGGKVPGSGGQHKPQGVRDSGQVGQVLQELTKKSECFEEYESFVMVQVELSVGAVASCADCKLTTNMQSGDGGVEQIVEAPGEGKQLLGWLVPCWRKFLEGLEEFYFVRPWPYEVWERRQSVYGGQAGGVESDDVQREQIDRDGQRQSTECGQTMGVVGFKPSEDGGGDVGHSLLSSHSLNQRAGYEAGGEETAGGQRDQDDVRKQRDLNVARDSECSGVGRSVYSVGDNVYTCTLVAGLSAEKLGGVTCVGIGGLCTWFVNSVLEYKAWDDHRMSIYVGQATQANLPLPWRPKHIVHIPWPRPPRVTKPLPVHAVHDDVERLPAASDSDSPRKPLVLSALGGDGVEFGQHTHKQKEQFLQGEQVVRAGSGDVQQEDRVHESTGLRGRQGEHEHHSMDPIIVPLTVGSDCVAGREYLAGSSGATGSEVEVEVSHLCTVLGDNGLSECGGQVEESDTLTIGDVEYRTHGLLDLLTSTDRTPVLNGSVHDVNGAGQGGATNSSGWLVRTGMPEGVVFQAPCCACLPVDEHNDAGDDGVAVGATTHPWEHTYQHGVYHMMAQGCEQQLYKGTMCAERDRTSVLSQHDYAQCHGSAQIQVQKENDNVACVVTAPLPLQKPWKSGAEGQVTNQAVDGELGGRGFKGMRSQQWGQRSDSTVRKLKDMPPLSVSGDTLKRAGDTLESVHGREAALAGGSAHSQCTSSARMGSSVTHYTHMDELHDREASARQLAGEPATDHHESGRGKSGRVGGTYASQQSNQTPAVACQTRHQVPQSMRKGLCGKEQDKDGTGDRPRVSDARCHGGSVLESRVSGGGMRSQWPAGNAHSRLGSTGIKARLHGVKSGIFRQADGQSRDEGCGNDNSKQAKHSRSFVNVSDAGLGTDSARKRLKTVKSEQAVRTYNDCTGNSRNFQSSTGRDQAGATYLESPPGDTQQRCNGAQVHQNRQLQQPDMVGGSILENADVGRDRAKLRSDINRVTRGELAGPLKRRLGNARGLHLSEGAQSNKGRQQDACKSDGLTGEGQRYGAGVAKLGGGGSASARGCSIEKLGKASKVLRQSDGYVEGPKSGAGERAGAVGSDEAAGSVRGCVRRGGKGGIWGGRLGQQTGGSNLYSGTLKTGARGCEEGGDAEGGSVRVGAGDARGSVGSGATRGKKERRPGGWQLAFISQQLDQRKYRKS